MTVFLVAIACFVLFTASLIASCKRYDEQRKKNRYYNVDNDDRAYLLFWSAFLSGIVYLACLFMSITMSPGWCFAVLLSILMLLAIACFACYMR